MSGEQGSVADKGSVAKDMIGMAMRVDDVSDRLVRAGADRRKQLAALTHTAAGVDHRDRLVTDDEADIGDRAVVLASHQRSLALMHEQTGSHFADVERLRRCAHNSQRAENGKRGKTANAKRHTSASVSSQAMSIVRCSPSSFFAPQHHEDSFLLHDNAQRAIYG